MKDFDLFIKDLATLISFESVYATPEEGKPFGEAVSSALNAFASIAKRLGFSVTSHDGYLVEVSYGEGEEVGIIGHLDVVPVGIGWNTPPFKLTEKEGIYYGRGIVDNKSPILLCLYALNELKNSGKDSGRKFRLFAGGDEESGWRDVEYFNRVGSFPDYGFSPDGNFPLTYAEKGITEIQFCLDAPKNFYELSGGTALNAVCDYAKCKVSKNAINKELLEKYSLKINGDIIESFGKAAHGSTPHLGKNAILPLLSYMSEVGENYSDAINFIFNDVLGVSKLCTEQGAVTLSPNLLTQEGNKIYLTCDCRIPYPLTEEDVKAVLDKFKIPYTTKLRHPPMCASKDGWLVTSLINAYNEVTGENAQPIAMGGSTFARAFKYGCSFGPSTNGDLECGGLHDANEFASKSYLLKCYEIYKKAIFNLAKI